MKNVNCLFLDRENIREGLKAILEGVSKVKSGVSIWIFPEGTRNDSDNYLELMPFKEGSLKIVQVGRACGYENQSYFNRLFKNYYGVTPKQYRENI